MSDERQTAVAGKLKTHKDLDVWRKSLDLVEMVYKVTKEFPKEELYGLPRGICQVDVIPWGRRNQLRRAAVSIPSNIVYPVQCCAIRLLHGVYPVQ